MIRRVGIGLQNDIDIGYRGDHLGRRSIVKSCQIVRSPRAGCLLLSPRAMRNGTFRQGKV